VVPATLWAVRLLGCMAFSNKLNKEGESKDEK
jgi:hypothetical protein